MCGGCGGRVVLDWATPVTTDHAARAAVVRTANELCRAVGDATRTSLSPSGYTVVASTGRASAVTSVTQLWRAVSGWEDRVRAGGLPALAHLSVVPAPSATSSSPERARSRRARPPAHVALLLGTPSSADREWADVIRVADEPAVASRDRSAEVLVADGRARVLVQCPTPEMVIDLVRQSVRDTAGQRRRTVSLVSRGAHRPGPSWVDALDALDDGAAEAVLGGAAPATAAVVDATGSSPASIACWMGAAIAGGALDDSRWRVRAGSPGDVVLLDAAHGHGLGVVPAT